MFNLFLRFQVAFGLKNMVILSRLTDTDLRGVRESREWEKRDGPSRGGGGWVKREHKIYPPPDVFNNI